MTPARSVVVLAVVVAGLLTPWRPAPAYACSCAVGTVGEHYQKADAVFTGRVVDRTVTQSELRMRSSGEPARHTFAVKTVYKGDVQPAQVVVSAGSSCGLEASGPGPFLVFATNRAPGPPAPDPGQYAAHLCGGTQAVTPAVLSQIGAVAGAGGPPRARPSPSAPPSTSAAAAASVSALRTGRSAVLVLGAGLCALLIVGGAVDRLRRRGTSSRS